MLAYSLKKKQNKPPQKKAKKLLIMITVKWFNMNIQDYYNKCYTNIFYKIVIEHQIILFVWDGINVIHDVSGQDSSFDT